MVLSVERMDGILETHQESLFAVVEPGLIHQRLREAVERVGLFYAPDSSSRGSCLLGGNIAHNSGGPRAVKYRATKDWIHGLEAVLPTGVTPLSQGCSAGSEHSIGRRNRGILIEMAAELYYLVTWNCAHIANAEIRRKLAEINTSLGVFTPIICTPEELMGDQEE